MARARDHVEQCLAVRLKLAERAPDDARIQRSLLVVYDRLAGVADQSDDLPAARNAREASLEVAHRLLTKRPDSYQAGVDLVQIASGLASHEAHRGDFEYAIRRYEEATAQLDRMRQAAEEEQASSLASWAEHLQQHLAACRQAKSGE